MNVIEESKEEQEFGKSIRRLFDTIVQYAMEKYRTRMEQLKLEILEEIEDSLREGTDLPRLHIGKRIGESVNNHYWTETETQKLTDLLNLMASPQEIQFAFIDKSWDQIYSKFQRLQKQTGLWKDYHLPLKYELPKPTPDDERKLFLQQ